MNGSPETLRVFLYALLTALATGLGVLPFFSIKTFSKRVLGFGNALAAGLILAAVRGSGPLSRSPSPCTTSPRAWPSRSC